MTMIKNANQIPKVFFGMHFEPGVAQYNPPDAEPYRILVNEETIRKMNETFVGRPVYVEHVDDVNLENIQNEADGYVIESFFNSADGKTWVKFIVVSDRGHEAISKGWKLSNAYIPKEFASGGSWHGLDYQKEVKNAEYEHLAIVSNPRYENSVILTPEKFKEYNQKLEVELQRVANEKEQGDKTVGLQFWKKQVTKVENGADLESTVVKLPKSGKEFTILELVNSQDKIENMHGYAADEHLVKVNDSEEMSVKDMRDCYNKMKGEMDEMKKKNSESSEDKEQNDNEATEAASSPRKDPTKLELDGDPKPANEADQEVKKNNFEKLANAEKNSNSYVEEVVIDFDRSARGKQRYGSN